MKRAFVGALVAGALIVTAGPGLAHVTVQPNEALAGSFSRFVVRVPNERPDASTVEVQVNFPPIAFVSFEPKEGWQRRAKNVKLEEPIDAFGQEITESVGSVTWSGGRIGPGEFDEFGFSARMPEEEGPIVFEAVQTYDSGEVVRWVGEADSEAPAAQVMVYDLGLEEGQGQLGALAELQEQVSADGAEAGPGQAEEEPAAGDDDSGLGLWLAAAALLVSLVALVLALRPSRKEAT